MKGKVLPKGISLLFMGMKFLGTPNDKAPNRTSLEATCRPVAISRMTSLHKCPSQAPRVARSLKEFEETVLTCIFCPDITIGLKGGNVGTSPR